MRLRLDFFFAAQPRGPVIVAVHLHARRPTISTIFTDLYPHEERVLASGNHHTPFRVSEFSDCQPFGTPSHALTSSSRLMICYISRKFVVGAVRNGSAKEFRPRADTKSRVGAGPDAIHQVFTSIDGNGTARFTAWQREKEGRKEVES